MKYSLSDNELMSSLLINNKDNIIKRFTVISDEEKSEIIDFFKSHSNLENKVDWNKMSNAQESLYQDIQNLMVETKKNAEEKKQRKTDIKSLFKDTEHFEVLGEDDNYVYVAPLTWDACVFIDSFKCGGQGATWCIGWEEKDDYWRKYTEDDNCVFVLMMKKPKSEEYILERLNFTGDIDIDKIYEIEWGEEDIEDMIEKYPNDNKVMFQIDSSGYATAWEQSDDFPLFNDARMSGIIERCELGFDWGDDEYMRISDLIAERRHGNMEGIIDDLGDEIRVDLDALYTSDYSYEQANDYITDVFGDRISKMSFVGVCDIECMVGEVITDIAIDYLDLSEMGVRKNQTYRLDEILEDAYSVSDTLDLSCFNDNSVLVEDFLNNLYGEPNVIIVNPNCTVLIDYINEYNQKHGTDIQIKMKYDYSMQPELDFGE